MVVAMAGFIIVGGGGHARVVHEVLNTLGHRVTGYTDPNPKGNAQGLYMGDDSVLLDASPPHFYDLALGIGKVNTTDTRLALLEQLASHGYLFPVIQAKNATVHRDVFSGEGTQILDGAVVVTGSRLGRGCIINTRASVDHDCRLGDNVHVAPGAILCGDVGVGHHSMIGAGATLVPGIEICAGCLIAAGATVVRSIDRPGVYRGTPARRVQ